MTKLFASLVSQTRSRSRNYPESVVTLYSNYNLLSETMKIYSCWVLFLTIALISTGCSASSSTSNSGDAYSSTIQPIFDAKCTACHGGPKTEAGLNLTSWSNLIKGSNAGEAVIAFNSAHSLLVKMGTKLQPAAHPSSQPASVLSESELATITAWIDGGAKGPEGLTPFSGNREFLYVTNQGGASISVIDVETKVVARLVDLTKLGFLAGAAPHHVAVEKDGSYWYATLISAGVILKFNRNNEIVGRAQFEVPGLLSMDPTSGKLFVGRSMGAVNPPKRIGMIDRNSMAIEELEVFFGRPHALAAAANGKYVYASSLEENKAVAIDIENEESTFKNLEGPMHSIMDMRISPDGKTLIAGGQLTHTLFFFNATDQADIPIENAMPVDGPPWDPIFSRDGSKVYYADKLAQTISIVDVKTKTIEAVIEGYGLAQPHGLAVSEDGKTLFVTGNNLNAAYESRYNFGEGSRTPGTVTVIDLVNKKVIKVIEVGLYSSGIAGIPNWN